MNVIIICNRLLQHKILNKTALRLLIKTTFYFYSYTFWKCGNWTRLYIITMETFPEANTHDMRSASDWCNTSDRLPESGSHPFENNINHLIWMPIKPYLPHVMLYNCCSSNTLIIYICAWNQNTVWRVPSRWNAITSVYYSKPLSRVMPTLPRTLSTKICSKSA